jgi:cytochrome P450
MTDDLDTVPPERFDYYDQRQMRDPFRMYDAFRNACPVGRSAAHGGFAFVSTYAGAKRVLSEFTSFSSANGVGLPPRAIRLYPVDLDPPEQNKFRRIVNKHFMPEAIAPRRSRIAQVVHEHIDTFIARGSADLAEDLVRPALPHIVLPIIGLPVEDLGTFRRWSEVTIRNRVSDPAGAEEAARLMFDYVMGVVADRRQRPPREDTLGALLQGRADGHPLSDEDIARTLMIIVNGGLDTTTTVILESLLHLSRHPDDAERLRTGEAAWAPAIEEFVRLFTPSTVMMRTVVADTVLEGEPLRSGEFVQAMIAAANRDPAIFAEPAGCVLDRSDNPHLSFGNGAHICLGRFLARLEIEVFLEAVLARLPDFAAAPDFVPEWWVFQGRVMKSLPVTFTPGRKLGHPAAAAVQRT